MSQDNNISQDNSDQVKKVEETKEKPKEVDNKKKRKRGPVLPEYKFFGPNVNYKGKKNVLDFSKVTAYNPKSKKKFESIQIPSDVVKDLTISDSGEKMFTELGDKKILDDPSHEILKVLAERLNNTNCSMSHLESIDPIIVYPGSSIIYNYRQQNRGQSRTVIILKSNRHLYVGLCGQVGRATSFLDGFASNTVVSFPSNAKHAIIANTGVSEVRLIFINPKETLDTNVSRQITENVFLKEWDTCLSERFFPSDPFLNDFARFMVNVFKVNIAKVGLTTLYKLFYARSFPLVFTDKSSDEFAVQFKRLSSNFYVSYHSAAPVLLFYCPSSAIIPESFFSDISPVLPTDIKDVSVSNLFQVLSCVLLTGLLAVNDPVKYSKMDDFTDRIVDVANITSYVYFRDDAGYRGVSFRLITMLYNIYKTFLPVAKKSKKGASDYIDHSAAHDKNIREEEHSDESEEENPEEFKDFLAADDEDELNDADTVESDERHTKRLKEDDVSSYNSEDESYIHKKRGKTIPPTPADESDGEHDYFKDKDIVKKKDIDEIKEVVKEVKKKEIKEVSKEVKKKEIKEKQPTKPTTQPKKEKPEPVKKAEQIIEMEDDPIKILEKEVVSALGKAVVGSKAFFVNFKNIMPLISDEKKKLTPPLLSKGESIGSFYLQKGDLFKRFASYQFFYDGNKASGLRNYPDTEIWANWCVYFPTNEEGKLFVHDLCDSALKTDKILSFVERIIS